jgi:hypothetical protein
MTVVKEENNLQPRGIDFSPEDTSRSRRASRGELVAVIDGEERRPSRQTQTPSDRFAMIAVHFAYREYRAGLTFHADTSSTSQLCTHLNQ